MVLKLKKYAVNIDNKDDLNEAKVLIKMNVKNKNRKNL